MLGVWVKESFRVDKGQGIGHYRYPVFTPLPFRVQLLVENLLKSVGYGGGGWLFPRHSDDDMCFCIEIFILNPS